jgi:hypothetical protein
VTINVSVFNAKSPIAKMCLRSLLKRETIESLTILTISSVERPLYKGHKQPQLPADLGFYDLRFAETRERQGRHG